MENTKKAVENPIEIAINKAINKLFEDDEWVELTGKGLKNLIREELEIIDKEDKA